MTHRLSEGRRTAAFVAVALFGAWEVASRSGGLSPTFMPAPTTVLGTLGRELAGGLVGHLAMTMGRVFGGLLLGAVPALLLGFAMGLSPAVQRSVDPFVSALHPIPKLALLPLLMVLLGIGEAPRLTVIAAGAFFPMLLNTLTGVRQISGVHIDVARSYGATNKQILRRVILPGSVPMVLTGLRLATNLAFLTAIAVEMLGASDGLGAQLWLSWQTLRVDLLFAVLTLIAVIGVSISAGLRLLARRGAPWLSEHTAQI